ncbi:aminotransferase class IV [Alphaproteobacteria bacterium]|jgi:branched-chain amino acid aminotransferase|nr:aminotransferase class IV [Alphaproteobacteria bacterium]
MITYLNGALIEEEKAKISVTDRGLTLGDGLFETVRARDGKPERLGAHIQRLFDGAAFLGITVPFNANQLGRALTETLVANELEEGILRLTLTRGAAARGLTVTRDYSPTLIITAAEMPPSSNPAKAWIARTISRNEMSPLSRLKTLCYLDNIIARRESDKKNADEAILLNSKGFIAEATTANLFVVVNDRLVTPPIEDGALPGVMRANILSTVDCVETSIRPKIFSDASEGFLTNSLGIRPLISVDEAILGNGTVGSVTKKIIKKFG